MSGTNYGTIPPSVNGDIKRGSDPWHVEGVLDAGVTVIIAPVARATAKLVLNS